MRQRGPIRRLLGRTRRHLIGPHRPIPTAAPEPRNPMAAIVDRLHYLSVNTDVAQCGVDPVDHFLRDGARENRAPHPWFSPAYVRNNFPARSLVGLTEAEVYRDAEMAERPRLLFVGHDATRTGAPAIILRLIEMFSATGDFECFTLLDEGGERLAEFAAVSHTIVMPRPRHDHSYDATGRDGFIRGLFAADGIFGANPPLAALVNSAECHAVFRSLAATGVPIVSLLHECPDYYPPARFEDFVAASQEVIFPSRFIHDLSVAYCRLDRSKVRVRGQGLLDDAFGRLDRATCRAALRAELDLPPTARIILNVGTADARKGIDLFVQTALEVLSARPEDGDSHFLWFGDGQAAAESPLSRARRAVERAGRSGRILFLPATDRIEEVFTGSDLFLLSARADPFPCVIHEAMACGLPVVAFRDGGGAQELIGADCGALARMGYTNDMSRVIASLLDDPEHLGRIGQTARDRIAKDWRYLDYHREVHASLQRHASLHRPFPKHREPAVAGHLFVLAGTEACAASLLRRLDAERPDDFEAVLLAGRFGPETDRCISILAARNMPFRVLQPADPSREARLALLDRTLRKPRPRKATLVNVLDLADPDRIRLLDYPVDAIETRGGSNTEHLGRFGPVLAGLELTAPAAAARILAPRADDRPAASGTGPHR